MNRLVHITPYYPPHVGGMENVARSLVLALGEQGTAVTVLASTIGAKRAPRLERPSPNVTVRRLRSLEFAHTPFMFSLPFWLLNMPRKSLFHVHIAQAFIPEIALLIGRLRGIPVVGHFHLDVQPSGKMGGFFRLYKKVFLRFTLRRLDRIIVFSKAQQQLLEASYGVAPGNIDVIPNAIDRPFFLDSAYQPSKKPLQLLYVGRLSKQKRVDRLLAAMTEVTVPVTLRIVGGGELEPELREQAKALGLQNVTFEGVKKDAGLRAAYRAADALVITSDLEGCPLVVLEAMAMKLPVIGTDVMGIRELVQHVGILASEPFERNLAAAMNQLGNDKSLLLKLSAQSAAHAQNYTWTNLLRRLSKSYREARS